MRTAIVTAAVCLSIAGLSSAAEVAAAMRRPTSIPAQDLESALRAFATAREMHVMFVSEDVRNMRASAISGNLTPEEALLLLLDGTGLTHRFLDDKSISIFPVNVIETGPGADDDDGAGRSEREAKQSSAGEGAKSFRGRFRLARAESSAARVFDSSSGNNDEESADIAAGGAKIEEIIVTATKREERLQDVPMSISVIGGQDIERRGLIGMEDYLRSIPGVNQIDRGGQDNSIVIRGITVSPQFENFNATATVASYFDESPITGASGPVGGGIDVRPVDIERIEVLRGPQGTAFGSSSLGGTLRLIPVKPKLAGFGAKLAASYSDTGGHGSGNSMFQGAVNLPILEDTFALRAVGYRYDESGFYNNVAGIDPATIARGTAVGLGDFVRGYTRNDVGRTLSTGGRLAALWQPADRLQLSMNFLTQTSEQDGWPEATVGKYEQGRFPIPALRQIRGERGEVFDSQIDLANVVVSYDLQWADLTSSASYVDGGAAGVNDAFSAGYPAAASLQNRSDFESLTTETRLASKLDGRLQFLGGVFYEEVEESLLQRSSLISPLAPDTFRTEPLQFFSTDRQRDQVAIFGEVSFDLTDRLTATVGGRRFEYDRNDRTLREGGFYRVPLGAGIAQQVEGSEGGNSYKANLSFKPTEDSLLYASWSQGFRLGRPTSGLPPSCDINGDGFVDGTGITMASTLKIDSDSLDNHEIGAKFVLFDRRMIVDTSVYHIEWDGLPITVRADACGVGYTANAGAATSDGVEFQASLFVVEGMRVDFGAGYTKAELAEDAPSLRAREGARLPGSPKVSANVAAQYDFEVAGYKAFVRADSFYAGKFYGNLQQSPLTEAGDYIKVDARAGVAIMALSVELFVRNLTNEDAFTWRGLSNANASFGYRLRPRTIGIQLGYSFE